MKRKWMAVLLFVFLFGIGQGLFLAGKSEALDEDISMGGKPTRDVVLILEYSENMRSKTYEDMIYKEQELAAKIVKTLQEEGTNNISYVVARNGEEAVNFKNEESAEGFIEQALCGDACLYAALAEADKKLSASEADSKWIILLSSGITADDESELEGTDLSKYHICAVGFMNNIGPEKTRQGRDFLTKLSKGDYEEYNGDINNLVPDFSADQQYRELYVGSTEVSVKIKPLSKEISDSEASEGQVSIACFEDGEWDKCAGQIENGALKYTALWYNMDYSVEIQAKELNEDDLYVTFLEGKSMEDPERIVVFTIPADKAKEGTVFTIDHDGEPAPDGALNAAYKCSDDEVEEGKQERSGEELKELTRLVEIDVENTGGEVQGTLKRLTASPISEEPDRFFLGQRVAVEASANDGYFFDGWLVNKEEKDEGSQASFLVDEDLEIKARFKPQESKTDVAAIVEGLQDSDAHQLISGIDNLVLIGIAAAIVLAAGTLIVVASVSSHKEKGNDIQIPKRNIGGSVVDTVQKLPAVQEKGRIQPSVPSSAPLRQNVPARKPVLLVTGGSLKGKSYRLNDGKTVTIGKDAGQCEIVLGRDYRYVSRKHLVVAYDREKDVFYATDFSKNGTFSSNKRRLPYGKAVSIKPGSTLLLGDEESTIRLQ